MSIVSDQVRLNEPFIAKFLFEKDENVVTRIVLFFTFCTDKMSMSFREMFWWLGRTKQFIHLYFPIVLTNLIYKTFVDRYELQRKFYFKYFFDDYALMT